MDLAVFQRTSRVLAAERLNRWLTGPNGLDHRQQLFLERDQIPVVGRKNDPLGSLKLAGATRNNRGINCSACQALQFFRRKFAMWNGPINRVNRVHRVAYFTFLWLLLGPPTSACTIHNITDLLSAERPVSGIVIKDIADGGPFSQLQEVSPFLVQPDVRGDRIAFVSRGDI